MLVGTIKYKKGSKTYIYNVEGVDTSEVFSLWLTSPSYEAITFMAGEDSKDDDLWERRFDIQLTKIKVETPVSINDKGKKVKAPVNLDFFCKLGSLLRWVKQNCNTYNEEGYTGLQLASGEFEVHIDKKYIIKFPLDQDRLLAKVVLVYGEISRINIETDTFSIDINEEYVKEPRVFKAIKDAVVSGIRFNEDYLGFGLKSQIINKVISVDGLYHSIEDIIDAHPDKEFRWLLKKDYRIVTDETLEEICNYILNWNGYVYYDTETTGLNINFKSRIGQANQLVGVVLSVKYGESFYFPTQMKYIKNLCDGDHWYFMEHYMKPILEGKELVCHNMEFDWKVSYIYGINANIVHDTMAILKLTLGAEIKDFKVGLKEAAKLLLGRDSLELSDLIIDDSWGQNDIKFWDLPEESVRLYACTDTDNTNGLLAYSEQVDLLGKYNQRKIYEIEIAFSFAVAYQEFYGHRINIDNLDIMREKTVANQELYLKQMEDIVGHKFNPNSPPQLIKILYTELGIPEQISRKTGKPTTDADTLKKLGELTDAEDNIKYPFVAILLKYRKEEGVRKIIDKFPELMTEDGYLFSRVMQYGTTTGRVSINNPNYQSYNNPVKENVIPRPGYYMFDTDYSSVEYRVLGNMVGNKHIMKSFEDPDFDYHQYQAARMYRVPYASVTSAMRKAAKGINFGLPYGMGDESLGIRVFGEKSEENTRNAAALRKSYFEGQEDIRDWFEFHRDKGVNLGYTETYFDRRRYYRKEDYNVAAVRRQAGNAVIQGTAADIYKLAVGRIFKRICKEGWLGKVLLSSFVHDEVLGEVSVDIDPAKFLKILREEFEVKIVNDDGTPWCPLYMGFGYGMSWYEAKSVELPIKLQWELVEKYGDSGFSDWDGDGRKFCDKIPDMLRDFEVRDIRKQILDADNQGKEIKPALNKQLLQIVKDDSKIYTEALSEYMQDDFNEVNAIGMQVYLENSEQAICEWLDKNYHIQTLYRLEDGTIADMFESTNDTQKALDIFCKIHGVDRSKVNLLNIDDSVSGGFNSSNITISNGDDEDYEIFKTSEERLIAIRDNRIDTLGMYLDIDNKIIYCLFVEDNSYINFIKSKSNLEGEGYNIYFRDTYGLTNPDKKGALYSTKAYIKSENIRIIQDLYLQYFRNKK